MKWPLKYFKSDSEPISLEPDPLRVQPLRPIWPPTVARGLAGEFVGAAGLDRIFLSTSMVIATGWEAGLGALALAVDGDTIEPTDVIEVPRPDVETSYPEMASIKGVLKIWKDVSVNSAAIRAMASSSIERMSRLEDIFPEQIEGDFHEILREYPGVAGALLRTMESDDKHLLATTAFSMGPTANTFGPKGYIEVLRAKEGVGGLCVGWAIGSSSLCLVDDLGNVQRLDGAIRWNRPDIFDAFSDMYGSACSEAGFVQALPASFNAGRKVRLLAGEGVNWVLLHELEAQPLPSNPTAYARLFFGVPLRSEQWVERFERHDGKILHKIIRDSRSNSYRGAKYVRQAGAQCVEPEVAIIIPLFGRFDFIDNQMIEFSRDDFIRNECDIIYVVDDPNILEPVMSNVSYWWKRYDVPFRVVWGGYNRGYSGANNLGLSLAKGRNVLFLNSDVIPFEPGWLRKLSARLDLHQEYGLLGTRLLFPDGGLQHDGITFEFSDTYGVWLNQHPGKGLSPDAAVEGAIVDQPAATGACLLGRREEVSALGGFSEDYLIGDFEDSDLCLKVEAAGRRIGVCPDIALTHLERQSFGFQGAGDFRLRVTLFNAWQHQSRWHQALEQHSTSWSKKVIP